MRTIDYQQRIAECARQADCAPNPLARIQWKRMEQFWRRMCAPPKPTESLGPLTFIEPETKIASPDTAMRAAMAAIKTNQVSRPA